MNTVTELQLSAELARAKQEIRRLLQRHRTAKQAVYYCCDQARAKGERTPKLHTLMILTGLSMGAVVKWRTEWQATVSVSETKNDTSHARTV